MSAVGPIPLRRPTILTGRNDSGKTATLDALAFLLGDRLINEADFYSSDSDTPGSPIIVSAETLLDEADRVATGLPDILGIRRTLTRGSAHARYEVQRLVPEDVRLRGLEYLSLTQLKETAAVMAVKPDGYRQGQLHSRTSISGGRSADIHGLGPGRR